MSLAFDATYYLNNNQDVLAAAVAAGVNTHEFAQQHFSTNGFKELRDPNANFDVSYYLTQNADVAAAGIDPFAHFLSFGASEGRAPTEAMATAASSFDSATYLAANTDVQSAIDAGTLKSAYQHWILNGQFEGRAAQTTDGTALSSAADQAGSTFTLTTSVDALTGTGNNDTFNGVIDDTFKASDTLDGGAGTDTFNIISTGAAAMPAATISNIENFFIRDTDTAQTYNFALISGESQVWNDRSAVATAYSNVASGSTVGIKGDGSSDGKDTEFGYAGGTAGSLVISGGVKGAFDVAFLTGLTSLSISSTGAANTIGLLDLDDAAVTVDGAQTDGPDTVKTLTINAETGLDLGTGVSGFAADATITITGAGAVDLGSNALGNAVDTVNAGDATGAITLTTDGEDNTVITTGSGNDIITTTATLDSGSINAGAGTDTLVVTGATINSTTGGKYTNFETLRVSDNNSVDASLIAGITAIEIADAGNTTGVTNLSAAQAAAVTLQSGGAGAVTIGVKDATTVGQIDTVTIAINDGDDDTVTDIALTAPVMTGVEKLVLNAASDAVSIDALTSSAALDSITINATHASETTSVVSGALALNANSIVDASASTASVEINFAAATGSNAASFKGGSGDDAITTGGINADLVNGGNGIDSITITNDAMQTGAVTITSDAIVSANADLITGFVTTEDKFDFNGALSNGSGAGAGIAAAEVTSNATITGALAAGGAGDDIVFIATTDLTGAQETAMDAAVTGGMTAAEADAVEAALVGTGGALNGTIANLDTVLGTSDSVLFQFSTDSDTFVLRVTNTDTSTENTLTADEIELVGVFAGATDLVAADYI